MRIFIEENSIMKNLTEKMITDQSAMPMANARFYGTSAFDIATVFRQNFLKI